jgi:fucose 4-O-acetylase-like acetyltransferase
MDNYAINKMRHFDEIDICKGIAILLVLIFHSFILYPIRLIDIPWCHYIMDVIASFFMPVFFLISGFLFANSRNKNYSHILNSKFKRLLIPFISYEVVTLGIKLAVPSLINRKVTGIGKYVTDLIYGGGELWFIYVLFLIFLVWGFLLPRMKRWMIIVSIIFCQILHLTIGGFANNIFLNDRIFCYSVFFMLGYLAIAHIRSLINKKNVLVCLAFLFVIVNIIFIEKLPIVMKWFLIAPIIGSLFCWAISFPLTQTRASKFLTYCGKYSLQFYIFNGFALVPARVLMCNVFRVSNAAILWISISIMSIIGVVIITEICKRIKYINFLFGIK